MGIARRPDGVSAIFVGSPRYFGRSPSAIFRISFHALFTANDWSYLAKFLYLPMLA